MLNVEDLYVKYPDGHQVLNQLNFQVKEGESVGIVGANGAGKSTLLMTLVGILFPSSGQITMNETTMNKSNLIKVRQQIGVVFQNPDDQLFMSNVYDDIAFGLRNNGFNENEVIEKVNKVVKALNIEKLMSKNSSKLSGGEKRIIAIATILVMEPSIVLFDEPSSFLDPKTRRRLMELLKDFRFTKLIATHDLDMALEICDRVLILKDGSIYADGKAKDLLTNKELLEEAGLELPFCLQNVNI